MLEISTLKFNKDTNQNLKQIKHGENWPVVYILYNDKEAYIGETVDASNRVKQHFVNQVRQNLKTMAIITDLTFNKSVTLDLEAFLIKYMSADKKFKLQNSNCGLQNYNYYQKEMYEQEFEKIWLKLRKMGLVVNDLKVIENSELFKYSPYKSLTSEQYMIINDILRTLRKDIINKDSSIFMVHGCSGTGKTILGIYLVMLLNQVKNVKQLKDEMEEVDQSLSEILKIASVTDDLKIGLVVPTDNLRKSIKNVFRNINGLKSTMVLSPSSLVNSDKMYDLLIVDEAHRLRRRKNMTQYRTFNRNNNKFNLGKQGTELDWILLKSKHRIFFYDDSQTIKPTDVRKEDFDRLKLRDHYHFYHLQTQLRCLKGGNQYVDYIKSLFSQKPPKLKINFKNYDLKIYDDVNDMIEDIKKKDKEYSLCRNVAGYAWPWKSKGQKFPFKMKKQELNKIINNGIYDIEINDYKYIWNSEATNWLNSPNSINEIGCVHTICGFDLNYTGVLIGNELKYDNKNKIFVVDKNNYYDIYGKINTTDDELLMYILNIYVILCTRGMLGTYIYVCDENLKNYLKKYID